jgi:hypothetical protein
MGQDTDAVLGELGYSAAEIVQLRKSRVVSEPSVTASVLPLSEVTAGTELDREQAKPPAVERAVPTQDIAGRRRRRARHLLAA